MDKIFTINKIQKRVSLVFSKIEDRPADVRTRSALPSAELSILSCDLTGVAQDLFNLFPEGPRPSAHQTAKPY
jgi:hypothetical protein